MNIERDPSGLFVGQVSEYPGIITQGRTRASVRRKLVRLLREIGREHPEDLSLFEQAKDIAKEAYGPEQ